MENKNESNIETIFPIFSSVLDDIEHKILSPLTCLKELDSYWILECDLPLVDKKDIKVTFEDRAISIEAKLREKYSEEKLGSITKFEFFKKSLSLPGEINSKEISAKFQKGRLEIKIPKKVTKRPIKVN